MTIKAEIGTDQLANLVKKVQEGNEVLLTLGSVPVARLISASEQRAVSSVPLEIRSLKGHRVLNPTISQGELSDEMFDRQ